MELPLDSLLYNYPAALLSGHWPQIGIRGADTPHWELFDAQTEEPENTPFTDCTLLAGQRPCTRHLRQKGLNERQNGFGAEPLQAGERRAAVYRGSGSPTGRLRQ